MKDTQSPNERTIGQMQDFEFLWFSKLLSKPVYQASTGDRIEKLADLVFHLTEPHPQAVGIYLEHGWGKPTEFIPWDRVLQIHEGKILVKAPDEGDAYPPFVDQPGWVLLNQHLMGRTILDTDGRKAEVVNDVHLLYSKGRMIIVHVDVSFNGFFRKWGLGKIRWVKDRLIPWKFVQPFSVEDAVTTDAVSLSVKREQAVELPGEDLADVLEMLSGEQQEAFFSALDTEKAAETLSHAEPRAQRQLMANLRRERAQTIMSELSIPQLADLFSVLPHEERVKLIALLPEEKEERLTRILSEREVTTRELMSSDFVTVSKDITVFEAIQHIRALRPESKAISYIYVVGEGNILTGVVDLRELVLADDHVPLEELIAPSVVAAEEDDTREDLMELFEKYHYRAMPVVDAEDHLLGVIHHSDIMHGLG
jgi:magnesium transporter